MTHTQGMHGRVKVCERGARPLLSLEEHASKQKERKKARKNEVARGWRGMDRQRNEPREADAPTASAEHCASRERGVAHILPLSICRRWSANEGF